MVSVAGPTRTSCVRARRSAPSEPGGSSLGLEHLVSRLFRAPGISHSWARAGSRRFPGDPSYAFALLQDPGRAVKASPIAALATPPPVNPNRRPQQHIISRLTQGFSIRCLRFTRGVAASHARLASGWRAAPLPGGGRTLRIASKGFRLHLHPPFQDFSCRKGCVRETTVNPSQRPWAVRDKNGLRDLEPGIRDA
jgi:hypothetical protein